MPFISEFVERWQLRSLDSRMMNVYVIAMFGLAVFGKSLGQSVIQYMALALSVAIVLLSLQRRIESGWQWQGASLADVGRAAFIAGAFPILIITVPFPALVNAGSPAAILCLLFAGMAYGVLRCLNVVRVWEQQFQADCGTVARPEPAARLDSEEPWKKRVRVAILALFVVGWGSGMASYVIGTMAKRYGSHVPTATFTEPVTMKNGDTYYVRPWQMEAGKILTWPMAIGIILGFAGSFAAEKWWNVRIFMPGRTVDGSREKAEK